MRVVLLLVLLLAGCTTRPWNGEVSRWGTLREVLRDGDTRGRVRLDEVQGRGTVGVGALRDLEGEVTLFEGRVWVARPDERGEITAGQRDGDEAAFLAVADVPRWSDLRTDGPSDLGALESRLATLADGRETMPFVVEGELRELDAHVLNGACPFAADPARRGEPVRFHREGVRGRLVGFFTTLPAGTLTHHGTRLHVHVILDEGAVTGHVDGAVIDGILRVPAR